MNSQDKTPHYIGHRQRLKNKFKSISHPSHITDYELIEMLLFYVFQRKDTKPLAKSLLNRFKTIRDIIDAPHSDLKKINGVGDSTIHLIATIHEILRRTLLEKVVESDLIMSTSQVLEYYKHTIGHLKTEQFRVMFLNNKNRLISEELMYEGTVNNTAIYPREIVRKALECGASAFIMVHNHPSGDPTPSRQDIIMTKTIRDIARALDVILLDHVVIGKYKTVSLKELRVI
jgi:DNA repair protein RadC